MSAPGQAATRRGRPVGSVKLTPDIERTIVAYIEAGAWDYVAAEVAGIDQRTFRDWVARGERRHPTRSATPALVRFARAVREAKARARIAREVVVADHDPKFWLSHVARSRVGREGWTDPLPDEEEAWGAARYEPTPEEAVATLRILVEAGVIPLPRCQDPDCTCSLHEEAGNG